MENLSFLNQQPYMAKFLESFSDTMQNKLHLQSHAVKKERFMIIETIRSLCKNIPKRHDLFSN